MNKNRHSLTLIELITVVSIATIILVISIASIRILQSSLANKCSPEVINGLLSSARAIASSRHIYTGVRFQKQDDIQYAVFITYDPYISYPEDNKTIPFTALENQPPFNLGRENTIASGVNDEVTIIFSPKGKLVRKWIKIFQRVYITKEDTIELRKDDIFGQYGLFPIDKNSKLSDNSFIIYNSKKHDNPKRFYINSYTGKLITMK